MSKNNFPTLSENQHDFITFLLSSDIWRFGEFKDESGRIRPYFLDISLLNSNALEVLGQAYAEEMRKITPTILINMIYGPSYKGTTLVSTTASKYAELTNTEMPFHDESENMSSTPLEGQVLILESLITTTTSLDEPTQTIREEGAEPAGVLALFDSQERGKGGLSAIKEVERTYGIPVSPIITFSHLLAYLQEQLEDDETENKDQLAAHLTAMLEYQRQYGVNATALEAA